MVNGRHASLTSPSTRLPEVRPVTAARGQHSVRRAQSCGDKTLTSEARARFHRDAAEAALTEEVKMKGKVAAFLASGALVLATASPAFASPSPPTNGGNGAGQSGQCTGPNDDRPSSCQSQGGPGNQP